MKAQALRKKLGELRETITGRLGITKKRPSSPRRARQRAVRFGPVQVTEFERVLCGGGGVPDGDVVSLGLGSPVRRYETEVRDRDGKDMYCVTGCLDVRRRAQLLCEWMRKKEYLQALRKVVKPDLVRLKRNRELSNAVHAHVRDMPTSLEAAVARARADAEAVRGQGTHIGQRKHPDTEVHTGATAEAADAPKRHRSGTHAEAERGDIESPGNGSAASHASLDEGGVSGKMRRTGPSAARATAGIAADGQVPAAAPCASTHDPNSLAGKHVAHGPGSEHEHAMWVTDEGEWLSQADSVHAPKGAACATATLGDIDLERWIAWQDF